MTRLIGTCLLLVSLAACGGGSGVAGERPRDGVAFLGGREVSYAIDHDRIPVGRHAGRFSALRIEVPDGALEMYDIQVHFADGSTFSPETRLQFRSGDSSRRIDLPGGDRQITSIDFLYRSDRPREGRANVRVYGVR